MSKNDPLMVLKSVKKISKHIGRDVANDMLIPLEEMKDYIKPKEVASIVRQYCIYKDDNYHINTLILQKIFTEVKNWVLGIQLAKMASEGKLETMWDTEQNSMIFSNSGDNNGTKSI